jgi:nitroreductase
VKEVTVMDSSNMSTEFYKLMQKHRSIRSYKNKNVSEEVLNRILTAATRASSSGNMQAYSIIVTQDPEIKKQLFEPHFKQKMVLQAPVFLTFCADFHRMRRWLEISEAPDNFDNFMSFMIAGIDAVLASQNAALAAEAEGLGICYMGTTLASCSEIARILKCPAHVMPVVGFSLGYPDENPSPRDRLPLKGVIHRETYQKYSDAEILEIYREKEEFGMKRYMEIPELRRLVVEKNIQNLAQVYTKAKYTKESHIEYSTNVLACLQNQGFLNK